MLDDPRSHKNNEISGEKMSQVPQLRWLERHQLVGPILLANSTYALSTQLTTWAPALRSNRPQILVSGFIGFIISTMTLYLLSTSINSHVHRWRYDTNNNSRNNFWLLLITFGRGWHNIHIHPPNSARQGSRSLEVDRNYYALAALSCFRFLWYLKPLPARVRQVTTHRGPTLEGRR